MSNKTRNKIQTEALNALKNNTYNGTICLSTGTGKSKVAIDAIKEGNFKNILITSPRTNLKKNWKEELNKWGFANTSNENLFCENNKTPINIYRENIQTCYKWNREELENFDLIICDEIHTIVTEEYGKILFKADELLIPVIGLTATPDNEKEEKKEMYDAFCPIIYEYYDSAKDGLVNKRKYLVYTYDLTDDFQVITGTKKKQWLVTEKKQYDYLSEQIKKGQRLMAATGSEDWFTDAANWFWKGQGDIEQKNAARIYLQAIKYRKEFLWNLSSSATFALQIKEAILKKPSNKVLLFSENIEQAKKLSLYNIHSKQDQVINEDLLSQFDLGLIRELASVKSLILGLNINKANYIIQESFNSSNVNAKQKMGRSDRLDVDDIATVIWLVPKNTQAETWFNKAMKNVDADDVSIYTDLTKLIKDL